MLERLYRHPLAELRARMGWLSATAYLAQVDRRHRVLGYGPMAVRREKVARWESGTCTPELSAQLAMASLHQVSERAVREWGWPAWLLLALPDDRALVGAAWTAEGTVAVMQDTVRREPADRRAFLTVTGAALTELACCWADSAQQPAPSNSAGPRLTGSMLTSLDSSLAELRHLDDMLGGQQLRCIATAELDLVTGFARESFCDAATWRRLFTTISEAARLCGWLHFDAGRHAAAQAFYITALRAAATAEDPQAGANALSFMAIQIYSIGNPHDAVELMRTGLERTRRGVTPRVRAMLHARTARALSKTPHGYSACARELDHAREAYAHGCHENDPDWLYWFTEAELDMIAGSCALDLDRPRQALRLFDSAEQGHYTDGGYSRDHILFLSRAAEAHLALGEIDQAGATARQALQENLSIHSTRAQTALTDLRAVLAHHRRVPAVRDFLDLIEQETGQAQ